MTRFFFIILQSQSLRDIYYEVRAPNYRIYIRLAVAAKHELVHQTILEIPKIECLAM